MNRNQILKIIIVISVFLFSGRLAYAAEPSPKPTPDGVCDIVTGNFHDKCKSCFDAGSTWTAVGCIPSNPNAFIGIVLRIAIGIGGGIAFLLILFGAFQIFMSAGNPESLNAGRELVEGAIIGLLFIIFSLFILRTIGASMLGIPGFK